jgi:hypothetical protein
MIRISLVDGSGKWYIIRKIGCVGVPPMGSHSLRIQIENEVELVTDIKAYLETIGVNDPEMVELSIESETSFVEIVETILKYEGITSGLRKGLEQYIADLRDRVKRYKDRESYCREMISVAMLRSELPKLETSYGTVSVKRLPEKLIVLEPSDIPSEFWIEQPRPAPILDEKSIIDRLKRREDARNMANQIEDKKEKAKALKQIDKDFPPVAGVTLAEQANTIQIRRK